MLREFQDNSGIRWRVWDVRPATAGLDRRLIRRRAGSMNEFAASDRRDADRRQVLGSYVAAGWLAFDSVLGRRRLMQIPQGWTSASDTELCDFCQQAQQAESRLEWGRSVDF